MVKMEEKIAVDAAWTWKHSLKVFLDLCLDRSLALLFLVEWFQPLLHEPASLTRFGPQKEKEGESSYVFPSPLLEVHIAPFDSHAFGGIIFVHVNRIYYIWYAYFWPSSNYYYYCYYYHIAELSFSVASLLFFLLFPIYTLKKKRERRN